MESTSSKGAHPFFVNDKHVFSLEWVENTQRTRLNLVLAFISATFFIRSASSSSEQPSSAIDIKCNLITGGRESSQLLAFGKETNCCTYIIRSIMKSVAQCLEQ